MRVTRKFGFSTGIHRVKRYKAGAVKPIEPVAEWYETVKIDDVKLNSQQTVGDLRYYDLTIGNRRIAVRIPIFTEERPDVLIVKRINRGIFKELGVPGVVFTEWGDDDG